MNHKSINSFKNTFLLVNKLVHERKTNLNDLLELQKEYNHLVGKEDDSINSNIIKVQNVIHSLLAIKKRIYSFALINDAKNRIFVTNGRNNFLDDNVYRISNLHYKEKFRKRSVNQDEYYSLLFPALSGNIDRISYDINEEIREEYFNEPPINEDEKESELNEVDIWEAYKELTLDGYNFDDINDE